MSPSLVKRLLNRDGGVLRLAPAWVPRTFTTPGGRLKLDRRDLYAFGLERGGICERWLASTTKADNGPGTTPDEGLSYIIDFESGERCLLRDAIAEAGDQLLGADVMSTNGGWQVLSQVLRHRRAPAHHLHPSDEQMAPLGKQGKPEAYYFPPQLNTILHSAPYASFGLNPGTTKEDVIRCLERWHEGDNGILNLSRAYKLEPGTGWNIPPGILHAPGSLVTYEPQRASDVNVIFQSLVGDRPIPWDWLTNVAPEKRDNLEAIVELIDWEANTAPDFKERHFTPPIPVKDEEAMQEEGYREVWIAYFPLLQRQGTDGLSGAHGHHRRTGSLRRHRRSRLRPVRKVGRQHTYRDPLRPVDRGRVLRHPGGCPGRRDHHQPESDRASGVVEALRTR